MIKICDIDPTAVEKLPPTFKEKSGIGTHYVDAMIKPMKTKLEDGTRIAAKRKGLKLMIRVGKAKGEGLMRRLEVSPDPVVMFEAALAEASLDAGVQIKIQDGAMYLVS